MLFPGEEKHTMTFLIDLSEEERKEFREIGLDCTNFVKKSATLAEERKPEKCVQFFYRTRLVLTHPQSNSAAILPERRVCCRTSLPLRV